MCWCACVCACVCCTHCVLFVVSIAMKSLCPASFRCPFVVYLFRSFCAASSSFPATARGRQLPRVKPGSLSLLSVVSPFLLPCTKTFCFYAPLACGSCIKLCLPCWTHRSRNWVGDKVAVIMAMANVAEPAAAAAATAAMRQQRAAASVFMFN